MSTGKRSPLQYFSASVEYRKAETWSAFAILPALPQLKHVTRLLHPRSPDRDPAIAIGVPKDACVWTKDAVKHDREIDMMHDPAYAPGKSFITGAFSAMPPEHREYGAVVKIVEHLLSIGAEVRVIYWFSDAP